MEKVSERVNALESFKKADAKADTSQKKGSHFGERPSCKVQEQCGPIKLALILTRRGLQRYTNQIMREQALHTGDVTNPNQDEGENEPHTATKHTMLLTVDDIIAYGRALRRPHVFP